MNIYRISYDAINKYLFLTVDGFPLRLTITDPPSPNKYYQTWRIAFVCNNFKHVGGLSKFPYHVRSFERMMETIIKDYPIFAGDRKTREWMKKKKKNLSSVSF